MALPAFRVALSASGAHPEVRAHAPTAAQTFSAGDVVTLLQANTLTEAADNDAAAYGVALDDAVDGDGNLRSEVRVAVFGEDARFSADNSGAVALALGTHQGDAVDLDVTAGVHSIAVGTAGTGDLFVIVGADSTDTSSGSGGGDRVLVAVPAAKSQAQPYGTAGLD